MAHQRRLILTYALVACCSGMILGCGGTGKYLPNGVQTETIISHEVLTSKKNKLGKFVMEILVSETASKQEVLKLAESLKREYTGKYEVISIFDSREAARRRTDESYPEKELSRHWLVVITGNEIRWVQELKAGTSRQKKTGAEKVPIAKEKEAIPQPLSPEPQPKETPKESPAKVEEVKPTPKEKKPSPIFLGVWDIIDDRGVRTTQLTLAKSFDAFMTGVGKVGTWEVTEDGNCRIHEKNGSTTILRPKPGKDSCDLHNYARRNLDGPPTNVRLAVPAPNAGTSGQLEKNQGNKELPSAAKDPTPGNPPEPGMEWVKGYVKKDGTIVKGHWRRRAK